MGQGRWIKEREGHYKHYTEEEYQNSPQGIAERWARKIEAVIILIVIVVAIIAFIVYLIGSLWQWIVGLFS